MTDALLHTPIAFISHSECDDAFCDNLYEALCRLGIRPIMDKRDFQPGDDLVKRVFDEGIGMSDGVVFVLSPGSVDRPWVRKELSVSVVQNITSHTRLIPVLLNGLPNERVPAPLAATVWIRIKPDMTPQDAAEKISTALHADQHTNPTIAAAPLWTQEAVAKIYGLDTIDTILFKYICERRLETTSPLVSTREVTDYATAQRIPDTDLETAIALMEDLGYLESGISAAGSRLPIAVRPSRFGIQQYMENYRAEEYASVFQAVIAALVNERAGDMPSLVSAVGSPEPLVDHIIDVLDFEGDIRALRSMGGYVTWHVNPTLRRRLKS